MGMILCTSTGKEDSDIFNRFQLAGYDTIQIEWICISYDCRGSRFKDGALRNPVCQYYEG